MTEGIDDAALVDLTRQLVRIPSVYDPDRRLSEARVAEAIAEQMRAFGWTPTVEEVAPGRPNVFTVNEGEGPGPTLLI